MLPSTYSVEAGRNKKIIRERLELGSSLYFVLSTYKKAQEQNESIRFFPFPLHLPH